MTSVQEALIDQMSQVSYCHSLFFATRAPEELARLLVESTNDEMARAFFSSSGSEAIEAALKMARQYHLEKPNPEPQRVHFISRQQSFHGTTLGALAAGGHVARRAIFEPILSTNTSRVSPCYAYRGMTGGMDTEAAYVRRLEAELDAEFQRVGPQKVAAFIAEPVVGAALGKSIRYETNLKPGCFLERGSKLYAGTVCCGLGNHLADSYELTGCVPSVPGYFKAVRRVCDKYGALLIMDEIMSGAGRTGPEPSERFPKPLHAWQDPMVGVVSLTARHTMSRVLTSVRTGPRSYDHGQRPWRRLHACCSDAREQNRR